MRTLRVGAGAVAVLLVTGATHAHLALDTPESRYGMNVLKDGPCGRADGVRSGNVTELEPGATIEVVFREYIDHPGHFRIAFDADGDDDFKDPPCLSHCDTRTDPSPPVFGEYSDPTVLLDAIPDSNGGRSSITITLPDVECDRCTLQVIQVMYDKRPITSPGNDIYYQCADLVLKRKVVADDVAVTEEGSAEVVEVETSAEVVEVIAESGPEAVEVVEMTGEETTEPTVAEPVVEETAATSSEGCGAGGVGAFALSGLIVMVSRAWRRRR